MTKEEIAYKETLGIFDSHELGITGLANAMDVYAKQEAIEFLDWATDRQLEWSLGVFVDIEGTYSSVDEYYKLFLKSKNPGKAQQNDI